MFLKIAVLIVCIIRLNVALPLLCIDNNPGDIISNTIEQRVEERSPTLYSEGWDWSHPILDFFKTLGEAKVRKFFNNIWNGIEAEYKCDTCEVVLGLMKISVFSASELNYLLSKICQSFRFEHSRVCTGMSDLFSGQLYFILKHTNLTKSEICATLIGAQCLSDPCLTPNKWTINLENKSLLNKLVEKFEQIVLENNRMDAKTNSFADNYSVVKRTKTSRILHLSDLHIDPYYDFGSSSECGEPLCCRSTSAEGKGTAGYWGDYKACDSPKYTIEQLMAYINTTLADEYQYIIWTGDIVAHDVWNTTRDTIINGSRSLTSLITSHISNEKLVFPVIGNHEGLPVNQFAPPDITGQLSISWLYSVLLDQWSEWIPKEYANTFKTYGYYANNVSPNLKVIVLNTNYCARLNFWLMYNSNDPGDQLKWLARELSIAEQAQQSVHIVGHIPPDNSQCISQWVHNYLRIIERYSRIVKGQYFGHTHFDEVRILYSPTNNTIPIGVAYLTPSVTTYESVNPAFRLYTIDSTGNVLDHQNYYMNLTDANKHYNESGLKWIPEYTAKAAYNMSSLVPSEWNSIYAQMKTDDNLFQSYYNHYHRYSDAFSAKCSAELKKIILEDIPVYDPMSCKK